MKPFLQIFVVALALCLLQSTSVLGQTNVSSIEEARRELALLLTDTSQITKPTFEFKPSGGSLVAFGGNNNVAQVLTKTVLPDMNNEL